MKKLTVRGKVVEGLKLGRKIGFPTANIETFGPLNIEHGVYSCLFTVAKKTYKAMAYFGPRVIFDQTKPLLEINIFDFGSDIYDAEIEVKLCNYIRETIKFNSIDELIAQLKKDQKNVLKDLRNPIKSRKRSKAKNTARTKKNKSN